MYSTTIIFSWALKDNRIPCRPRRSFWWKSSKPSTQQNDLSYMQSSVSKWLCKSKGAFCLSYCFSERTIYGFSLHNGKNVASQTPTYYLHLSNKVPDALGSLLGIMAQSDYLWLFRNVSPILLSHLSTAISLIFWTSKHGENKAVVSPEHHFWGRSGKKNDRR